jgi:O-antigen/teichoic acid export membrane protein
MISGEGISLVRQALRLSGATGLSHALVLIAAPIITRIYEPQDFGSLGILLSFAALAAVAVSFRYDFAIPTARSDDQAVMLVWLSLALTLPTSCLFAALMFGLQVATLEPFSQLPSWSALIVIPLLIVLGGISALRFWCVRESKFGAVGTALISQGIGRSILPILLAPPFPGLLGLALAELFGRSLGLVSLGRAVLRHTTARLFDWREAFALATEQRKFPLVVMPSSLLDAIGSALPLFIVGALFGRETAGQFVLVSQVAMVPGALIGATVGDIFYSEFARAARTGHTDLPALLRGYGRHLGVVSAVVYTIAALVAPFTFPIIFGADWYTAGLLLTVLSPSLALTLVVSPLSRALLAIERPEAKLIIDAMLLVVPPLTLWALREQGVVAAFSGYSLANAAVYASYLLLVTTLVREYRPMRHGA